MAICAEDIEQIRTIVYERAEKTEAQIESLKLELADDMKELSKKLDTVIRDQTVMSERVTRLEVGSVVLEDSRKEQGKRIGECEQKLAVLSGEGSGREKSGAVARWAIPVLISAVGLGYTLLMALTK